MRQAQAIDTTLFDPVLSRLDQQRHRLFESSHVVIKPLALMERPGSCLLRAHVEADQYNQEVFVKIYKLHRSERKTMEQRVIKEFATTKRAYDGLRAYAGLAAVKPIACFSDDLAIITERAEGEPFASVIERGAAWWPEHRALDELSICSERIGQWLKAFQRLDGSSGRFSLDGMREYIDVRLETLVRVGELSGRDRAAILNFFDHKRGDVCDADLVEVPVHGDYSPDNVLVRGREIIVIDFLLARRGALYHDLAHMFMRIDLAKANPCYRFDRVSQVQKALLRGFEPTLTSDRPLFRLLSLQHTLSYLATMMVRPPRHAIKRLYAWYLRQRHHRWLKQAGAIG